MVVPLGCHGDFSRGSFDVFDPVAPNGREAFFSSQYGVTITLGGLLGTIMFLNVWLVIWPNQQIVIASANQAAQGGQPLPAAAGAGRRAGLTSRTNTVLSIPMLFFMGAAMHIIPDWWDPRLPKVFLGDHSYYHRCGGV